MRIAVAVHGYPPSGAGGVERVASEQAEALAARGHSVAVFAADPGGEGRDGETRNERVGSADVRRVRVRGGSRSPFSEYYDGGFLDGAFRSFLDEVRPDVLHVQHLVNLSNRLVALAREAGLPTVVSLHDAYYLCHRLFLIDRDGNRCPGPDAGHRCIPCLEEHGVGEAPRDRFEAMARMLAGVDAVLAPSPSLRRRYEADLPFLRERIEVIEPGLARVPRARPRGARGPGQPLRLVFIGTLLPHKGLDVLIAALESLPRDDFDLTIYGEDVGSGSAELRERTRDRAVHWGGRFAPHALEDVLAAADVLVVPSRCDESWSRVVREARAAGVAVVATAAGGPADWLRDDVDAILVPPDSAPSLRRALARLRGDPAALERLSRPATGLPTVAEAAAALERVFDRVVAARAASLGPRRPRVSVAYVTKNGSRWLEESLRAVRAQRGTFDLVEILAVDSGSADDSVDILERHGARVLHIAPEDFGHGRTRNLLAREARGDVVVFLTQDAAPADERWLDGLVAALVADPLCAAAWSRHVPRPECHPMEWRMLAEHPPFLPGTPSVQSGRGNPAFAADPESQCSLSNNSAAYRREVLLHWPFPEVRFGEDRAWARVVLEAGWRTVLARRSIVRHSHSYSAWANLRRNFDHWRSLTGELGHRDSFTLVDGWRASVREARRDVAFWAAHTGRSSGAVALRWGARAILYHFGAFTGRWLGSRADRLPRSWPDRLSMHAVVGPGGSKP